MTTLLLLFLAQSSGQGRALLQPGQLLLIK
jgi:hypothetical protein